MDINRVVTHDSSGQYFSFCLLIFILLILRTMLILMFYFTFFVGLKVLVSGVRISSYQVLLYCYNLGTYNSSLIYSKEPQIVFSHIWMDSTHLPVIHLFIISNALTQLIYIYPNAHSFLLSDMLRAVVRQEMPCQHFGAGGKQCTLPSLPRTLVTTFH